MAPTLREGEWALALRTDRPRRGDVVVVEHPRRPGHEMAKRLVAGPGDEAQHGRRLGRDEWWVEGDAPEASTDSRAFGPVPTRSLIGRVVLVWWPRPRLIGSRTRPPTVPPSP